MGPATRNTVHYLKFLTFLKKEINDEGEIKNFKMSILKAKKAKTTILVKLNNNGQNLGPHASLSRHCS